MKCAPSNRNHKDLNSINNIKATKRFITMKKEVPEDKRLDELFKRLQETRSKTFKGKTTRQILHWARTHG